MYTAMIQAILYRTVYVFFHLLYRWYLMICAKINLVALTEYCHEMGWDRSIDRLTCEIQRKNRIPKHLTVLIGTEEPSHKDLVNIIMWCLKFRIVYLSFYDYKGLILTEETRLKKTLVSQLGATDHVIWHNRSTPYKNGITGRKIHVKILSRDDGKPNIAKAAKELCKSKGSYSLGDILQRHYEFPHPDLAISFGYYLNLYDYPPWQIDVTEILRVASQYGFTYKLFLEQLHRYGHCEQRLGR